ncbi:PIN domain-containing protein [Streptomyces sp. NPDC020794]|uniref:PIN domain-containing protein n=1 Tax=Streptomyces sp. NPDC020794 TaxID=3365090 RepID=UPI0037A01475
MIILDTCILRGCGLGSSSADLLRTIRGSGIQRVAVPWVVMEELAAQHAVKYEKQYESAAAVLESLRKLTPWSGVPELGECDLDRVREHWRREYGSIVDVIPTSEEALREAAFREANGLAPSKIASSGSKSVKTGYRDVAIWMSAIEYGRQHPQETVYFVSSNTEDFGDGTSYRHPMSNDVVGLGSRFVHLTSLDQVVSRFTHPAEVDDQRVQAALARSTSLIAKAAFEDDDMAKSLRSGGFECILARRHLLSAEELAGRALAWVRPPDGVEVGTLRDVNVYRIGNREWFIATVRWHLAGPAVLEPGEDFVRWRSHDETATIGCSWETRVLCTLDEEDSRLVVLRSSAPQALSPEEFGRLSADDTMTVDSIQYALERVLHAGVRENSPQGIQWQMLVPKQGASYLESLLAEARQQYRTGRPSLVWEQQG